MIAAEAHKVSSIKSKIPEALVYETINGKPVYYRDYRLVINKEKTIEEIMGSSSLQSIIITILMEHFFTTQSGQGLQFLSNEVGLHLRKGDNLNCDIAIVDKSTLIERGIKNKYLDFAPKIVVEVDTKAELSELSAGDYFNGKTKKLLDLT